MNEKKNTYVTDEQHVCKFQTTHICRRDNDTYVDETNTHMSARTAHMPREQQHICRQKQTHMSKTQKKTHTHMYTKKKTPTYTKQTHISKRNHTHR